jgi:hypothetical protein
MSLLILHIRIPLLVTGDRSLARLLSETAPKSADRSLLQLLQRSKTTMHLAAPIERPAAPSTIAFWEHTHGFYDIGNTSSMPPRAAKNGMPVNTMGGVEKWAKPPRVRDSAQKTPGEAYLSTKLFSQKW